MLSDLLSHALNQLLATDPTMTDELPALEGKTLTLVCKLPIPITLQCTVKNGKLCILIGEQEKTDARITGTPLQLFRVGILQASSEAFQIDDILIEGDIDLANHWLRLFRKAHIDLEEYASTWIGDVPAHTVQHGLSHIKKTLRHQFRSLTTSIDEYLHEESDWFPTQHALNTFFTDVDKLREDTDRIAAKIALLGQKIKDLS